MRAITILAICAVATVGTAANAQEVDWKKVDEAMGRSATVTADVHRYGFPRTDLQVTLDGVSVKPGLALGGWTAMKPAHDGVMVMGDLVLLETEISPVMSKMIQNGLEITALHNHLLRSNLLHARRRPWRSGEASHGHSHGFGREQDPARRPRAHRFPACDRS